MDNIHSGDIVIKSEHYKVEVTGGNSKNKDLRPGMEAFEDDKAKSEPTGINMKGKSLVVRRLYTAKTATN